MSMRLSEHCAITLIETTDVGGTTAETGWVSMENYSRAMAYVELGTWNASDDLDHCRIECDVAGDGGSITEVTTDASGGNYDTDNPIDADGNFVIIEIRAENLTATKPYIRLKVGEDGNTGTDNVTGFLVRYGYAYPKKELQGAASTGAQVYVDPGT